MWTEVAVMGDPDIEIVLGTWSTGRGPLHRKLSDALQRAIEHRALAPGTRLPAERELARRLMVSRSTVVTAYDALRARGLLESRRGSGTRVATATGASHRWKERGGDIVNPVFRALLADPSDVYSLAAACNPAHPLVADAMADVVASQVPTLLAHNGYLPSGLPSLRAGLAAVLTASGVPTVAEQVLVTTGAQQAINLCAALFAKPADTVVVESPGFPGTLDAFRATPVRFATVPVDDEGVDTDRLADVAARTNPAAIYVMPTFQNPTGAILAARRREQLADLATASGVPIIEDNALEHLTISDEPPPPPIAAAAPAHAPVLSVGSFSKLAWGGLRIGWVRAPESLIDRLALVKARSDLGTPLFDQAVAERLLQNLPRLRADRRHQLTTALARVGDLLHQLVPDWRWRRPQGGPALWIELPTGTAGGFAQMALRFGIEVIPGDLMSPTGEHPQHFRLPFTAEGDELDIVIRRLAEAWAAYTATPDATRTRPTVVV
jgi:DNA-binding transcriptional MocR family regulator